MTYLQVSLIRKCPKSNLRDIVGTVGNLDIKQLIVPLRKATRIRNQKENPSIKRNTLLKETTREKNIRIRQKINCYKCGEYGHYAHDCPKPHGNANTAQESEQIKKFKNMMDLDNSSLNKVFDDVYGCTL